MGLVLKITGNNWINESRDKRELSVYRELGYEVAVLAKGEVNDRGREEIVDGFKVFRYTTRPCGTGVPNSINRVISLFKWAAFAKNLQPDVITGHDLRPGLIIAWLATLLNKKKPKLIYDSHEFELGLNVDGERSKFTSWIIAKIEKFIMKRCVFSIMVNDSIADEVQKTHSLKERPVVVRNIPNYWNIDENLCKKKRMEMLQRFHEGIVLMFHGGIMRDRGVENLIKVAAKCKDARLVLLGNGTEDYIAELKKLSEELAVDKRVLFHAAVPLKELWQYVGAADISVIPMSILSYNHFFSLPNKLFESIQSLTPVIGPEVPEIKRIITKYKIGLTCKPGDVDDICLCVNKMAEDKIFYNEMKNNLKLAKQELCWENEKKILAQAFRQKVMGVE